jgi:hypothetical protein
MEEPIIALTPLVGGQRSDGKRKATQLIAAQQW